MADISPEAWARAEEIYPEEGSPGVQEYFGLIGVDVTRDVIAGHMRRAGIRFIGKPKEEDPEPTEKDLEEETQWDRERAGYERESRILKRKYNELVRQTSMEEVISKLVTDYRDSMPVPELKLPKPGKRDIEESAVLLLSDLHVGETVSSEATYGINRYDIDVFLARMEALAERIESIVNNGLSGHRLTDLRIYLLGDLINGEFGVMHDELIVTQAANLMDTVYGTSYVLAQFIGRMLQWFDRVHVSACPGNHGRMTRKPMAKEQDLNWDMVVPQITSTFFVGNDRVEFNIPKSFFFIDEVRGHKFLGLHGHQVRGYAGIPWYGINRAVNNLDGALQEVGHKIKYVVLGHFHQSAGIEKIGGEVIANPCLKGPDEFSLTNAYTPSPAAQWLFGVHADHGITHRWKIEVQDSYEPRGDFTWYPGNVLKEVWESESLAQTK